MIGRERNGDGQQQEHGMQVQFMCTRKYQSMLGLSCSVLAWHGIYNTKGWKQYSAEMMQQCAALLGSVPHANSAKHMHSIPAS